MSTSYRQILRSSSIVGGASVVGILVAALRAKVAAILLGPAGVGLIGLLQSLMATGSAMSALGFGTVGTRQIAEAVGDEDPAAVATARRALFWGTLGLGLAGAAAFWLLRHVLAARILRDPGLAGAVGWLGLGVAFTVASGSQGALLIGLRRTGDIARVWILSALLSTTLGITALWLWGESGILAFVISAPLASFLLGQWFVSRLPKVSGPRPRFKELLKQWKTLAQLGSAFMISSLAIAAGQLAVRSLIQRELGAEPLGYFQAAWMISMTYMGIVLRAMGTDYYPRLTAAMRDHATANRLVNEQSEVALLLGAPLFLVMLGGAPWIIELLFSSEFADAIRVLRWQVLGDILKVVSWPLGFILLAAGDGRMFMLTQSFAIAVFVGLTWIGLPLVGVEAAGIAFVGMYLCYLGVVFVLARRKTGLSWHRNVYAHLLPLIVIALVVFAAASWSKWLGAAFGMIGAVGLGLHGLARLGHMTALVGPLGRISERSRRLMMKLGIWRE